MTTLLLSRRETAPAHLARRVARAIGGFEHALLGRVPHSLTVVTSGDRLVVNLLESFSPLERGLAAVSGGAGRIRDFHHGIFESCHEALVQHVRRRAGVALDAGIVHVDATTGSIIKTYTTESSVDLFILGQGVPALGVPVNAHLHAHGAAGTGAVRS